MALSGTINKTFGGGFRIQIEWTATQNISANTSTITANFYLISLGSWHINSQVKKTVRIKIDGTTYTSADQTAQLASNQKKLMATATKTITHNADGTRSFYIGGSIDIQVTLSGTWYGTVTIPDTQFTLNTIPRASSVSVSPSSVNFGNSVTINISRHSSSFTHTLRYNVAGQSGTIATGVGTSYSWSVPTSLINGISNNDRATCTIYCDTYSGSTNIGTKSITVTLIIPVSSVSLSASSVNYGSSVTINISRAHSKLTHSIRYNWNNNTGTIASSISYTGYSWTVPNNFMNYIPNSTSTTGTIYVDTYNGTKLVGTKSINLKTNVPSSVVPSFSSIGHSEQNSAVAALNLGSGVYARNLSKIKFTINGASGAYGSTITKYKIVYDGTTYNSSSATTGTIKNSGTRTVTATITDSRGRTASKSTTVSVLAYNSPSITSFSVRRCNADGSNNDMGEYIKVTYGGSMSNLNSKNTATVYLDTKPRSSGTWTTKNSFAITGSFSGTKIVGTYGITQSYDVRIRVVDKFHTVTSTQQLSTAAVTMSWGKQGVGIGKIWEQGALDVGGSIYSSGYYYGGLGSSRIPAGANLNDYTTPGLYYCPLNVDVATMQNCPTGNAFSLFVEQHAGCKQTLTEYMTTNAKTWTRNYYSGTWGAWTKLSVDGHTHAWSAITSKPSTFTPSAHSHSGADITSGTVPYARLPVGTGSSQVAQGSHTHSYLPLSGGTLTGNLYLSGGTRYIGTSSANTLEIRTSGTTRLSINTSGHITYTPTNDRGITVYLNARMSGSGGTEPTFHPSSDKFGFLGASDRCWFRTYSTQYYQSSSIKHKTNLKEYDKKSAYEKLKSLVIYDYDIDREKENSNEDIDVQINKSMMNNETDSNLLTRQMGVVSETAPREIKGTEYKPITETQRVIKSVKSIDNTEETELGEDVVVDVEETEVEVEEDVVVGIEEVESDSIDLYSFISFVASALQEAQNKIEYLEAKVQSLTTK
jgi:hypothetical protein